MSFLKRIIGKKAPIPTAELATVEVVAPAEATVPISPKDMQRQAKANAALAAYETLEALAEAGRQWEETNQVARADQQFRPDILGSVEASAANLREMLQRAPNMARLQRESALLFSGAPVAGEPALYDHGTAEVIDNRLHQQVDTVHTLVTGCVGDMKQLAGEAWKPKGDQERRIDELAARADAQLEALNALYLSRDAGRSSGVRGG